MMDYEGFWTGFVVLFVLVPVLLGAGLGAAWAWRCDKRGRHLVTSAIFGGGALTLCVLAGAVLIFGA